MAADRRRHQAGWALGSCLGTATPAQRILPYSAMETYQAGVRLEWRSLGLAESQAAGVGIHLGRASAWDLQQQHPAPSVAAPPEPTQGQVDHLQAPHPTWLLLALRIRV